MEDKAASILGGFFVLFLLITLIYSVTVWCNSVAVLWEGDKWSCTKTVYPSPDKKEMFYPYCVQWSIK